MTKPQFISACYAAAVAACAGTPIFVEVLLAEGAMESEWGESWLTKEANNWHGIKSTPSWEAAGGKYVTKKTYEWTTDPNKGDKPLVSKTDKGVTKYRYTIEARFRQYDNIAKAFENYVHFVTQPGYVACGVTTAKTPEEQIKCIGEKYATGPQYAELITQIIHGLRPFIPTA